MVVTTDSRSTPDNSETSSLRGAGMPWLASLLKAVAVCAVLSLTNPGALKRILLQLDAPNYPAFAIHIIVWIVAAFALWSIMFERSRGWRLFGAGLVAASTALSWGFRAISKIEFSVFDGVALWEARHEAANAAAEYSSTISVGVILFALVALIMYWPVKKPFSLPGPSWLWRWLGRAAPIGTVAMIAMVMFAKSGGGYMGMPRQFSTLSIVSLVAFKEVTHPMPEHAAVTWTPTEPHQLDKIVMLVDESIRGDYLNPKVGGETPGFATAMQPFVNYGATSSGGICSNYSNTLLRYAAARADLGPNFGANPTLFQYAKKAGYRTVYIDGQARMIGNLNGLQNFMSLAETGFIDTFYGIKKQGPAEADFELGRILKEELAKPGPVFIYANKEGAHIPFDQNYPADETLYRPTMAETGRGNFEGHINSYKNAVAHNVDKFFAKVWPTLDTSHAGIVYTSDHAQYLNPNGLTHCLSEGPNQRMALVPLYVYADDPAIDASLRAGVTKAKGRSTQFMIAPTLLSWMGYGDKDVSSKYHESLTAGTPYPSAFTTGDTFGVFNNPATWNVIDLAQDYRSTEKDAVPSDTRELGPDEQPWLKQDPKTVAVSTLQAQQ